MINQIIRITILLVFSFTVVMGNLKVRAPKELVKRFSIIFLLIRRQNN